MVAPTGLLSLPLDFLRNTVASSPAFQAWTGTASEALAKPRVHTIDAPDTATLPLAVVDWQEGYERRRIARGSHNHFEATGSLTLIFRAAITEALDEDAAYDFLNNVGAVIGEMELVAGQATYLDIEGTTLVQGPYRPEENEALTVGDYYEIVYAVEFLAK